MERNEVITSFKKKEMPVLVATDVAGMSYEIIFINYLITFFHLWSEIFLCHQLIYDKAP